jgi:hypothetical protein
MEVVGGAKRRAADGYIFVLEPGPGKGVIASSLIGEALSRRDASAMRPESHHSCLGEATSSGGGGRRSWPLMSLESWLVSRPLGLVGQDPDTQPHAVPVPVRWVMPCHGILGTKDPNLDGFDEIEARMGNTCPKPA